MKRSLMLPTSLLSGLAVGLISLYGQAANPNPAPKCSFNQIPVLKDNGSWECQVPQVEANEKPQQTGLLLPAVQKAQESPARERAGRPRDAASGMPTGKRQHKPVVITKNTAEKGVGRRSCPQGYLPKLENGSWRCKALEIAPPTKPQRASTAGDRPKCAKDELPKLINGTWFCKKRDYAQKPGKGEE